MIIILFDGEQTLEKRMNRKLPLLAAVVSILIATYAVGWRSLADEWGAAPTPRYADSYAPLATGLQPGPIFDTFFVSPVRLPDVVSPERQASWTSSGKDLGQQSPDNYHRLTKLPSIATGSKQSATETNLDIWGDHGVNLTSGGSPTSTPLPTVGPLFASPATPKELLFPPEFVNGANLGISIPVRSDISHLATPELIQEFPYADFEPPRRSLLESRVGWWSVDFSGNPTKIGEYQSLNSSVFLDVDGLITNGLHTWDFYGTLLDNDSSSTGGRYFGPLLSARWDYERYFRRLDRDPLAAFVDFDQQPTTPLPAAPANFRDMKEDLSVGEDFAIRVQEVNASFKGELTNNLNWRFNVWGMRKHGERQATALAHCFTASNATDINGNPVTGVACHILSQSQRIDWQTVELEPVLEGKVGPVTAEYSRKMRALSTGDQLVTRPYDNFGIVGDQPYNVVPENFTAIDRVKLGITLPERRDVYARVYNGNTRNNFRDTNRRFHGIDLRVSDRSVDGFTLTAHTKTYVQTGQVPSTLLQFEDPTAIRFPINYDRANVGLDTSWRPFYGENSLRRNLRLSSGYEYRQLDRENALFVGNTLAIDQSSTISNNMYFRASMKWTPVIKSHARYRLSFTDDPLFAVAGNDTTNTSLPTQVHHVEFGSTWSPTHTFLLTGLIGLDKARNSSSIANSREDNYDLVFTAWYAPTPRWSITGGLAFYANWIDQDITLGPNSNSLTLPWEYGGRSDTVNVGTTFAWTKRMTLSGTLDYVNAENSFDALAQWPDLPFLSDVKVRTTRFTAGVDYDLGRNANCYVRYQLFDYEDNAAFIDSGRAELLMFGGTAIF